MKIKEFIVKIKKINYHRLAQILILIFILGSIGVVGLEKINKPAPIAKTIARPAPVIAEFNLSISSLDISVPVIPDVDGNDKDAYFKALQDGVAQYKGTAKPGEGGNIFIFGHSSFYFWDPGNYKEIFKNLEDIEVGNEIQVAYNGKNYQYKVTETKTVDPTDVEVLRPTSQEQLTLMTCVPPGTAEKRFIVIAKPF